MTGQETKWQTNKFVLNDDEVVKQFAAHYERLFADQPGLVTAKAIQAVQHFLQEQVLVHFAYEERHILPGLLDAGLGAAVASGVAEICQDHQALRKEIRQLIALLATPDLNAEEVANLRDAMVTLGRHLKQHSFKENKLFPSLV